MLKIEFDELFNTLFTNSEKYILIAKALSEKKSGLTRQEIIQKTKIQGSTLTKMLSNLEKCDFNTTNKRMARISFRADLSHTFRPNKKCSWNIRDCHKINSLA